MPTYTSRGLPLYSDTEAMPGWDTGYNAQSTALNTALDNLETDIHDADSVATFAALPVTGNWPGRLISVVSPESVYRWDGAAWVLLWAEPTGWQPMTLNPGWTPQSPDVIEGQVVNGWGKLSGRIDGTAGAGQLAFTMPTWLRPTRPIAILLGSTSGSEAEVTVTVNPDGTVMVLKGATAVNDLTLGAIPAWPVL